MSSRIEVSAYLTGVPNLIGKIRMMDVRVQQRVREAVRKGTEAVTAGARQRAPKVSGELAASIRSEFEKDGLTGWTKAGYGKLLRRMKSKTGDRTQRYAEAKARHAQRRQQLRVAKNSRQALKLADLGVYAPVVERGDKRRNKPKRPFMYPSLHQETPAIASNIARAVRRSADEVTR